MKTKYGQVSTRGWPGANGAEPFELRPVNESDAQVVQELASDGVLVYQPRCPAGKTALAEFRAGQQPAILGKDRHDEIVGMAWLGPSEGKRAAFGMVVRPGHNTRELVVPLLRSLVAEARRLRHSELTTCVTPGVPDPISDLREGGLRVVSAFTTGGVSDVRLALN
ncbi:MAG: hypothetical protein M0R74_11810 [Dehalococcoidia bacterium]|nr:hypothetical protein [Dehalococcoidia bacterium]